MKKWLRKKQFFQCRFPVSDVSQWNQSRTTANHGIQILSEIIRTWILAMFRKLSIEE